ncbi:uncharacterized protein LOC131607832 [Vicia villosa]|uniref:uncharacterized protein LOC131607832 n=1 Tax=Vicia villosa TaxID=3911 RepID=UPI00273C09F2|nr:uncharacterized protein LOC131607832 [Vicia villosa]
MINTQLIDSLFDEENIIFMSQLEKFQDEHNGNVMHVQSSNQTMKNRECLRGSIAIVLFLTFNDSAFSGDGETIEERYLHSFNSMAILTSSFNEYFANAMLEDDEYLSKCASSQFRKQVLQIVSSKVKSYIREEIGDSKFCILVDGARDGSEKEQMAVILRFVDKKGFIRERMLDIVHVKDCKFKALAIKEEICHVLSRHNLDVSNIRGQGYDGSCEMREQWDDLRALFLDECPYAYHIHCFAHKLQVALICASSEVYAIQQFFLKLTFIVDFFSSCSKPRDIILAAKLDEISHLLEINEFETGNEASYSSTLQRVGDTRSRSHFSSICSLINMYDTACYVLEKLSDDEQSTYCQRGDASIAYDNLNTFEFVLILHLMKNIMAITDILCQALQHQYPDVVNVKHIVRSTKVMLQNMKQNGWDKLLKKVTCFCVKNAIEVPQLNARYAARPWRSREKKDHVTTEYYFRVEVFLIVIDKHIQELNSRFSDQAMELLTLCSALVPKDTYKTFNIGHICTLVEKYYPRDFNEQEKNDLRCQLQHFIIDAHQDSKLNDLSTIQELCTCLAETKKSEVYYLIDRLLRIIMTLPVYMPTTERSFSAMKNFKTMLRNMMEDEFQADSMLVYIEKDIAKSFRINSIVDDFESLKEPNDSHPCNSVNGCIIRPSELLGEEEPDGSLLPQVAEDMVEDEISSRSNVR